MKSQVDQIDATPQKRLYLSIIADYDTKKAICELVDNAIDIWTKTSHKSKLNIEVTLDANQQRIHVQDNAGGVPQTDLSNIVGPGHTTATESDEAIGIFGVGTKRAVIALAQDIKITTRHANQTYQIEFTDDWIKESDDWTLPVFKVDNIPQKTTRIELLKLRSKLTPETEAQLTEHLGATYARFLENKKLRLSLNNKTIASIKFDNWAYPPKFEPRRYIATINAEQGGEIRLEVECPGFSGQVQASK